MKSLMTYPQPLDDYSFLVKVYLTRKRPGKTGKELYLISLATSETEEHSNGETECSDQEDEPD